MPVELSPEARALLAQRQANQGGAERPGVTDFLKSGAIDAYGGLRYGLPRAVETALGTNTQADDEYYAAWQQEYGQRANRAAPGGPANFEDLAAGRAGVFDVITENVGYSLPYLAAGAVGGFAGAGAGPAGALAGATAAMSPLFAGSNAERAAEDGTLTQTEAAKSLAFAPVQAAGESLVGRFIPGVGRALGLPAVGAGGFLSRTGKSVAKAAVTEGITETGQQALERAAAGLPMTGNEAMREFVNAFGTGAIVGGALGVGGGVYSGADPNSIPTEDIGGQVDEMLGLPAPPAPVLPSPARTELDLEAAGIMPSDSLNQPAQLTDQRPGAGSVMVDAQGNATLDPEEARIMQARQALTEVPSGDLLEVYNQLKGQGDSIELQLVADELVARSEARSAQPPAPTPQLPAPEGGPTVFGTEGGPGVIGNEQRAALQAELQQTPEGDLRATLERVDAEAEPQLVEAINAELSARQAGRAQETQRIAGLGIEEASRELQAENDNLRPEQREQLRKQFDKELRKLKAQAGSRNKFVRELKPETYEDLEEQVYRQIFEQQDTSKGTQAIAQRLGIIDQKGNETDRARQVNARINPEWGPPVPPRDPEFDAEMQKLTKEFGYKDQKGVKSKAQFDMINFVLDARTPEDLEGRVYNQLAIEPREGNIGKYGKTRLEQIAQRIGLLDRSLNPTQRYREVAELNERIPAEERMQAAIDQGFTGTDAAWFERGTLMRSTELPQGNMTQSELKAFVAGREYRDQNLVPEVAGNQETIDTLNRISRGRPSEDQAELSMLNNQIDLLTRADPDDVATLKMMVRNGRPVEDVRAAVAQVASGGRLFKQPARQQVDFKTEVVTPGARNRRRIAERKAQRERDEAFVASRQATKRKGETVGQANHRIVGELIQEALATGRISQRQYVKAAVLRARRDYDGVKQLLSRPKIENEMRASRREFLAGVAATAAVTAGAAPRTTQAKTPPTSRLVGHLQNGNIVEALKEIESKSPRAGYRVIANLLRNGGGWENVALQVEGDRGSLHGSTRVLSDGSSLVRLYGTNGVTEETVLHELLHAFVQQRWAGLAQYLQTNKRILGDTTDRADALVQNWQKLWRTIGDALEAADPDLVNNEAWAGWSRADPDEMLSWVMTNADAQAYLKTIDRDGNSIESQAKSMWQSIVDWIASLFGSKAKKATVRSALDEIMDAGHGLLVAGKNVKPGDFSAKLISEMEAAQVDSLSAKPPTTANELNSSLQGVADRAQKTIDRLPEADRLKGVIKDRGKLNSAREFVFGFNSVLHLADQYGGVMPAIKKYYQAHQHRRATEARIAKLFEDVYQRYDKVRVDDKASGNRILELMRFTIFDIDPRKGPEAHEHLKDKPNQKELRAKVKQANDLYRQVQKDGNAKIYEDLIAINEMLQLASASVAMRNLVLADKQLASAIGDQFAGDPMAEFRENAQQHSDAQSARDYWSDSLNAQLAQAEKFISQLRGSVKEGTATPDEKAMRKRLNPLENQVRQIYAMRENASRSPYFHLGRQGKYFVAFTIGTNQDGTADAAKVAEVEKKIAAAGFENAQMSTDNTNPKVYITLENERQRAQMAALAKQMASEGLVDGDTVRRGRRGGDGDAGTFRDTPEHLQQYLALIRESELFQGEDMSSEDKALTDKFKAHVEAQAREIWLDLLPDSSLSKVLAPRAGVQGADNDMMRSFASRLEIGGRALAGLSTVNELSGSVAEMRATSRDAQLDPDKDVDLLSGLTTEILKREARRAEVEDSFGPMDTLRAASHAYFLGASVSYGMLNMTQIGVLLWPELAKNKGGFVKGAKALAKVTPDAFKIMNAMRAEVAKHGWRRWGDVAITADVLRKAGVSKQTTDFVMQMVASGVIDIGAAARELGRVAEGKIGTKWDTTLRLAGGVGLYTETFTRLVAALSAREMRGGSNSEANREYARNVVDQTMLNYSTWNTARQLGKAGPAGQLTPVVTQFYQYSAQVLEKMYREIYRAVGGEGTSAEQKAEARRFIGAHLAAVTVVAGSLGLPFATVAARTIELLVDLLDDDDEPFDFTAAYRHWLAGMVGKDAGEVIARGLPRAIGVDISQRAGEQDLIPFSRIFADRRTLAESGQAWLADNATGAAGGMIGSVTQGVDKLADGDILGAFAAGAPLAIRGVAKAGVMSDKGYVDSKGNVLPVSPDAGAYLVQALGFSPAEKAEYSEERGDQLERKGALARRAKELRDRLVKAVEDGDRDAFNSAAAEARKFDADNPAYRVMPDIAGSLKRRQKAQTTSRASGLPLGVDPKDLDARRLTGYGNYN